MEIAGVEINTNMAVDDMYGYVDGYEHAPETQATADNSTSFQNLERGIWVQRDGTPIAIKKMQDSHIRNCIRMLEKGEPNDLKDAYIKAFEKELKKRERNRIERD